MYLPSQPEEVQVQVQAQAVQHQLIIPRSKPAVATAVTRAAIHRVAVVIPAVRAVLPLITIIHSAVARPHVSVAAIVPTAIIITAAEVKGTESL